MTGQACAERVHSDVWHSHGCTRSASVERDSKWYCGTHDPEKIAQRRQIKNDARAAEAARLDRIRRGAADLVRRLGAGNPAISTIRYPFIPTGGVLLTKAEAETLADELDRLRPVAPAP